MGELKASSEQITASSQFASGKAGEMESGISSFSAEVDAFLSGGWQGQASEAFQPPFQDWVANAKKVQQALSDMADLLAQSAKEYASREEHNDDLIKSVQVKSSGLNF
ncbi:WXG100 family type VII secretion target [Segniliparus rugosus]|uniref:ESAT-6-like protein n=1 Tax=Segniliparus rugosus (strain ATCC BAA-974 / DSM 45345 / CCUG 50838 / CIP 108380 / JCM 13579 / CDC 945) TaxID=679197 RepID=E5XKZ5_SEGRC|nr:WXG100 family type VII secretion target [Segniliparus rugosus]EFV14977.1 WXG100 family type VII secretion target [Segniliparus rugosus ATCC BAA-974]